jgi:hypothetical protein
LHALINNYIRNKNVNAKISWKLGGHEGKKSKAVNII